MELEVYKKSDFYEDYISSKKEYYDRENADAYFAKRLAEKDKEIAELKAKVDELSFDKKLLESHWESEKIRCEATSRDCIELSNENAKLVSKIESLKFGHRQGIANIKSYYKAKLESVQASMYADVVDANMENRRLKRALWIARANRALEKIAWFKLWNSSISTMNPEDGARQEFDKWKRNLGKFFKKVEESSRWHTVLTAFIKKKYTSNI